MSNYTKSTNFATKDNLTPGDPLKVVRGTEIDTEFNNIATAIATKTDNSAAAITGGTITGITDLAIADGGTGASTATAAINNLLPVQTSAANKYLQSDGTNVSWDAVTLSTADITGTLPVANGGTGVTSSTGTGNVVLSNSPTLVTPALGTPASGVATNLTGLPISTGVSGLGTGVATFLGTPSSANLISAVTDETGTGSLVFATSPTLVTPALGTPSALVGTNITGTASGLTAGNVTTNANLTGAVTSVGNATSLGSFSSANLLGALTDETGTGSAVFATSPTLVTPILGTPTSATLTNATGLPISTGVSGLGTGVATFLATPSSANLAAALTDETGSGANVFATSPTLVTPILGTPTSATLTNATGLPLTTGVTGTLPTANGGTNLTSFTSGGVVYASSTSALATGSTLAFDGTNLLLGTTTSDAKLRVTSAGTAVAKFTGPANSSIQLLSDTVTLKLQCGGEAVFGSFTNTPVAFVTNNTERVRIDTSGNLGIGTSSPSSKLDISDASGAAPSFRIVNSAAGAWMRLTGTSASTSLFDVNGLLAIRTGASYTTALTIDASQNMGLGVAPSAWLSSLQAIQVKGVNGIYGAGSSELGLTQNAFYNASSQWIYGTTSAAGAYQISSGVHKWLNAASGTAGNAITFTQAMTLDASGNLLVGTTTATQKLTVSGNVGTTGSLLTYNGATVVSYIGNGTSLTSATDLAIRCDTGNIVFGFSGTERVRISASGGLSVGTNTDAGVNNLIVNGTGRFGTTVGVGATTPSTSGAGITFPATQSASSNANTLDDYEEGTFTPTIIGTTTAGTGTYTEQTGKYTKIGNVVTFTLSLNWSAHTGTGSMQVGAMPFTAIAGHNPPVTFGYVDNIALTANNYLQGYVPASQAVIGLVQSATGGGAVTSPPVDTAGFFVCSGTYFV